ncbi:response regulator [Siminovitchia acidinfaciens]|uniref:Response regulator n=1 Tax=Siminovitchia acidinfaciens TaxID=2321395 RepID=A0A429XVD0_9BACI|nr:response regulator [Siminovitchia acidinfaciens]RST72224.1 response regulator [Siminovitchia acidinfaciens]
MRAILIDDEPLAMEHMEKLLKDIAVVEVIGKYLSPLQGLKAIMHEQPDVVFLDIEMPTISGIELAENIQSTCSNVHVVFVTAYDEYAVKAFELNAVDYVMKPIQRKRLNETIKRLQLFEDTNVEKGESTCTGMICCFQTLRFVWEGDELEAIDVHWRTTKAKELFAYLVHHRREPVGKEVLIDLFWAESEPEKGYAQLYAAIYQIRKTLASIGFDIEIKSREQTYMIDMQQIKVDIDEFERLEEIFNESHPELESVQKLLDLYSGDYLEKESYLWAESERERLRVFWLYFTQKTAEMLIQKKEHTKALLICQRVQALNPYSEEIYFMLMRLYDLLGERHFVEQQYHRLEDMLFEEYGTEPAPEISQWYQNWKGILA